MLRLKWTCVAIACVVGASAAAQDADGYSPAARRMFKMVGDCPAGGEKNLNDEARLKQKTQLREAAKGGAAPDSDEESVYDLQRNTENRCR